MVASKFTKEEILDHIFEVFRRFGYDGSSLQIISKATGLGRASLYHHFPGGKEEMVREVINQVGKSIDELMLQPLATDRSPQLRLQAWAKGVDQFYSKGNKNCLLGVLVLSGANDRFAEELAALVHVWVDSLAKTLHDAGFAKAESRRRAENALGRIQGGLIVSRSLNSPKHFQRVMRELPEELLAG